MYTGQVLLCGHEQYEVALCRPDSGCSFRSTQVIEQQFVSVQDLTGQRRLASSALLQTKVIRELLAARPQVIAR